MNSAQEIWDRVLAILGKTKTQTTLSTWFDDAEPVALTENYFILCIPVPFKRDVVTNRFLDDIRDALYELFSAHLEVMIISAEEKERYTQQKTDPQRLFPGTENYTFERFVVGNSNKFAHAAAQAVASMPGQTYNPLFIYGDSGLGKTHLLYAIAHAVHESFPAYRIVYIRGDAFTNELISAIREGRNEEFRAKYRTVDVFLMDDVQFIAGRDSTQEEMFHTFNALYEENKQIVFTADRPPKEMLRLDDRLKTRFEWGLLADIVPPDYETRMAIIKNKAIRMGIELPEEVLTYVAENITANVRQIEGTVNKMLAYRDLMNSDINISTVIRVVRDILKDTSDILPTAQVIIEEVGRFYDIDEADLRGHGRTKATNKARQIAIYLTRQLTKLSLTDIGKEFGDRDHSTILHSYSRMEKLCKEDPETEEIVKDIKTNINARYG